jgi:hypothetical protein
VQSDEVDLAGHRKRDESLPLQAQGPKNLNRPLADVLGVFIQQIPLVRDALHGGRNQLLHECFLSVACILVNLPIYKEAVLGLFATFLPRL